MHSDGLRKKIIQNGGKGETNDNYKQTFFI